VTPPFPPFFMVAMLSTYREGPLAFEAAKSCFDANMDGVVVWEGQAGPARAETAPETELPAADLLHYREGAWASDAAKRTAMLKWAREKWHQRPLWIVWLDGDEVLVNGRYLRDMLQLVMWEDELRGASIANPDNPPSGGLPLRLVEADGSVSFAKGRCVRGDFVRRYTVSNLMLETVTGLELRLGNVQEREQDWTGPRREMHGEHMVLMPPLPCEPFVVHRSHLRHPARQTLRLHEQEHDELVRLGLPTGKGM
jgi:hypothetical protein